MSHHFSPDFSPEEIFNLFGNVGIFIYFDLNLTSLVVFKQCLASVHAFVIMETPMYLTEANKLMHF